MTPREVRDELITWYATVLPPVVERRIERETRRMTFRGLYDPKSTEWVRIIWHARFGLAPRMERDCLP